QMLAYQRQSQNVPALMQAPRLVDLMGHSAARAQARGFANICQLVKAVSTASVTSTMSSTSSSGRGDSQAVGDVELVDTELLEQQREARDRLIVDEELERYLAAGIIEDDALDDFDLVSFWQGNQHQYPLLYHVALDILPVQASAVPCERVFSSSGETDDARRSRLSVFIFEVLQILKYLYRHEHLNFTADW
ncbi:hATC-domain-containing protein, partial [Neolentinus lepideus HHB14362 ss-1]